MTRLLLVVEKKQHQFHFSAPLVGGFTLSGSTAVVAVITGAFHLPHPMLAVVSIAHTTYMGFSSATARRFSSNFANSCSRTLDDGASLTDTTITVSYTHLTLPTKA